MLKSKELGKAIEKAIELKIATGAAKNKSEIARHFGVKPPSVYDWMNKGSIAKERLPELWNYFSDVVDLAHWGIESTGFPNLSQKTRERREKSRPYGDVPMLKWNLIFYWITQFKDFERSKALEWMPCPVPHGPLTFALKIENEAMYQPMAKISFLPGDIVFIDPDREPLSNSFVITYNRDTHENAQFRQLVIDGDKKYLATLNATWPGNMIMMDDTTQIGGVAIYKGENI